jgi:hypothetical protein
MSSVRSTPSSLSRAALSVALAAVVVFVSASEADARSGGGGRGGTGAGSGGWHGGGGGRGGWHGGGGSWSGNRGSWNGGHANWSGKPSAAYPGAKPSSGWHGGHGGHGNWHGRGHGHGHGHWHGWHGGRYYYPGWALGLGVGIGLTYPWWGWGWGYPYYPYYAYPSRYVVYENVYDAPVGVVIDREGAASAPPPAPAYRWYCPSPPGYHPDVGECSTGWLKVVPQEGGRPPEPPSAPPPSTTPRSWTPTDEAEPASQIAPGAVGKAAQPVRIAAPRMTPPAQLARGYTVQEVVAQNATQ